MDDAAARALLRRLGQFLDQFAGCFGHCAQRNGASRYVEGLLNDSERKSMQPMHGRLSDPGSYQGLQHFITHSPWSAGPVWRRLRAALPVRRGVLIIDETSFPKQGHDSVGVARQYCGALGKIANCQVAVSTVLLAAGLTWPTTLELYLPETWATDERRRRFARIPPGCRCREKWRLALSHLRQVRASGITIDAVVGDAEYGRVSAFRTALERLGIAYALGVRSEMAVWARGAGRTQTISALSAHLPASAWRRVGWRRGTKGPLAARFAAVRVRPAKSRTECWLLCEQSLTPEPERKHYFVQLPATASLRALVRLARSRWPIEQHYQDLKDELGLDHFEGRSYPGWTHHAVMAAVTYAFLQLERRRRTEALPTFPTVRTLVREILTTLFFVERRKWFNLLVSFQRNPPLRI